MPGLTMGAPIVGGTPAPAPQRVLRRVTRREPGRLGGPTPQGCPHRALL
jgi:hypothetical protein